MEGEQKETAKVQFQVLLGCSYMDAQRAAEAEGPQLCRTTELGVNPTLKPRERRNTWKCNFDSAQLGGTRSSVWFDFLVTEVKADKQKIKAKNTVAKR